MPSELKSGGQDDPPLLETRSTVLDRCHYLGTRPLPVFSFRATAGEFAVLLGLYRGVCSSVFGRVAS